MNYWMVIIVEEGLVRHLAVWDDDLKAKQELISILAPKFGFRPGGDVEKDWVALEEAHETFGDDGDCEFYLQMLSLPFPEGQDHVRLV